MRALPMVVGLHSVGPGTFFPLAGQLGLAAVAPREAPTLAIHGSEGWVLPVDLLEAGQKLLRVIHLAPLYAGRLRLSGAWPLHS